MSKKIALLAVGTALATMGGCSSLGRAAGLKASSPDEFRVVTKPPLTVPPEYSLRPPAPGETRPSEINPERLLHASAFGQERGANASMSEKLLVAHADAIAVSPSIRELIDYEEASMLHKSEAFSDKVVNWQGNEEEMAEAAGDSATGGAEVVIAPTKGPRIKLPGT